MSPSGFGEPSGAQNLWSPGFVVVRLCMRINSVDTGPTSLTPERPRANERGSRPQEWPSARQGRCGSARATRRSPRRRGRWPRPSLSTGSTTARWRRQEAWANRSAPTDGPRVAQGVRSRFALTGAIRTRPRGQRNRSLRTGRAAPPRRGPSRRPLLRKERSDTFPTRNPDESAPQGCLRPRSARRTAACGPSEGSFPAHRQPHRPWVVRHRRKRLAHLSIPSRPAFPDAAFLGISESRSRTAASASAPARRPQSWRRPRSPTFRQRAELAAPRARIAAAPTTSAGGSSAICTTARSSAWSTR